MSRRVFYGGYRSGRKKNNKKKALIILSVLLIIGLIIWFALFFTTARRHDVGTIVKSSVEEITQLKLQLKEKDDEILSLKQQIEAYEAELALRPTIAPSPLVPPNDEVLAAQATPTPSATPRRQRSSDESKNHTSAPVSTPVQQTAVPEPTQESISEESAEVSHDDQSAVPENTPE